MTCQKGGAHIAQLGAGDILAMLQDTRQFHLAFQPQVHLKTGQIESAEALARWKHPLFGELPPALFIPEVAAQGLQDSFFRHVARLALDSASTLRDAGYTLPLSINACATTLSNPENLDFLREEAFDRHVEPTGITVELTEETPAENMPGLQSALTRLQRWGFRVSLDDFGSGHANLNLLMGLTFDELKLDRVLSSAVETNPVARQSVSFALKLARQMNWHVVAEGISSVAQLRALYRLGCRHGQGFLMAPPMPLEQLMAHPRLRLGRPSRRHEAAGEMATQQR